MLIQESLQRIHTIIQTQAGDRPVTLIAVTKYASVEQMREAYYAGIRHFGENKVQDALTKMALFSGEEFPDLNWHLIGSLQSNKANKTVGRFALIHSVDSVALAERLSRQNEAAGHQQKILLQVNVSDDPTRMGFTPDALLASAQHIAGLPGIVLQGLMTMAPPEASLNQNETTLKACFHSVSALKEALEAQQGIPLPELSMGMSHDFPQALACGATIIRIGNYLFKT
ncbi:YggS family pyridoxal phosphate-dependent enzyme [Vampirovibrio sp.]|uniref:YggS family pyridoxal phosphate-dependent enzyme n=1 Tax=Vampirovibrio sp. TaxID=2717857 RepID=UPI0035944F71